MKTSEQQLLQKLLKTAAKEEYINFSLRETLLAIGGEELIAQTHGDVSLILVMHGAQMPEEVIQKTMQDGASHRNVSLLWIEGLLDAIGTGYALSKGLWRRHSWGVKKNIIVETTAPRLKYFGVCFTGEAAGGFAEWGLA